MNFRFGGFASGTPGPLPALASQAIDFSGGRGIPNLHYHTPVQPRKSMLQAHENVLHPHETVLQLHENHLAEVVRSKPGRRIYGENATYPPFWAYSRTLPQGVELLV